MLGPTCYLHKHSNPAQLFSPVLKVNMLSTLSPGTLFRPVLEISLLQAIKSGRENCISSQLKLLIYFIYDFCSKAIFEVEIESSLLSKVLEHFSMALSPS